MGDKTTIQITVETQQRLQEIGGKKDTYDHIISRLLDMHTRKEGKNV